MPKMPQPVDYGRSSAGTISRIMAQRDDFEPKFDNPGNGRVVMGHALPSWQRPLVWTMEQKVKFIESAWMGMGLGTYTVNNLINTSSGLRHPLNNLLIDGQQRLSALEAYLNDEFSVFGAKWSEVEPEDKRRFKNTKFSVYETESVDENYLKAYYDLMNFGGTAHTPSQSASLDVRAIADRVLDAVFSLQRERSPNGEITFFDSRLAEPEVNDPGPVIALIPSELPISKLRGTQQAVYREAVLGVLRQDPSLRPLVPDAEDLMPAWIVNENGDDVLIMQGRGSDDEPYRVDRETGTVLRVHEDGLVSGEFDLHDVPFSKKVKNDFGFSV